MLLVIGIFACFMAFFALTVSRFSLTAKEGEVVHTIFGFPFMRQRVPLEKMEELTDGVDPQMRARALLVASDETTIVWAHRGTAEEIAWFRDALLRAAAAQKDW